MIAPEAYGHLSLALRYLKNSKETYGRRWRQPTIGNLVDSRKIQLHLNRANSFLSRKGKQVRIVTRPYELQVLLEAILATKNPDLHYNEVGQII